MSAPPTAPRRFVSVQGSAPDDSSKRISFPSEETSRRIPQRDQPYIENARFMPDGLTIAATAHEPNRPSRVFLFDLAGKNARPISPEGFRMQSLPSPDGRYVIAGAGQVRYLVPTDGGPPRILKGLPPRTAVPGWTSDGKSLLWFLSETNPIRIMKLDITTEQSVLWKEIPLPPAERAVALRISPDGGTYAVSLYSDVGDVYVLEAPGD